MCQPVSCVFKDKTDLLSFKPHCFPGQLPRWLSGKEPACQCRHRGFDLWVGKIPWRRKQQPTQVFLPGKTPLTEGCKESDATWWLNHHYFSAPWALAKPKAPRPRGSCCARLVSWNAPPSFPSLQVTATHLRLREVPCPLWSPVWHFWQKHSLLNNSTLKYTVSTWHHN